MKSKSLFNALSYTKSSNPITCISNYSSSIICIKTIHALEELNEYKSISDAKMNTMEEKKHYATFLQFCIAK